MADGTMSYGDIRDWFAGMAMSGMCAHPNGLALIGQEDLRADAILSYRIADAMLAARASSTDEATK